MKKQNQFYEEDGEEGELELIVYVEPETLTIRSVLDGNPVFEISGNYSEEIIKSITKALEEEKINSAIKSLLENVSSENQNVYACTIYDSRFTKLKKSKIFLKRRDENQLYYKRILKSKSALLIVPNTMLYA